MYAGYTVTQIDHDAKYYCEQHGITCEIVPIVTGSAKSDFKIGINHNGQFTVRDKSWSYLDREEALYDSYRGIAAKLINNER